MTVFVCGLYAISIHTPLAGSDRGHDVGDEITAYFNPHSPCGERHVYAFVPEGRIDISIHTPLAGSDFRAERSAQDFLISIHTPLAGSDPRHARRPKHRQHFNPHSPCGERHARRRHHPSIPYYFNPHSPCGERPDALSPDTSEVISIHTPLAGSDIPLAVISED